MAKLKDRVSLYLNPYEQELLLNTRIDPVFGGKFDLNLPETKDVLQALLYFTHIRVKNTNSLKALANGIFQTKKRPELDYEEEIEGPPIGSFKSTDRPGVIPSESPSIDISRSKNVIFPLEKEDTVRLESIESLIKKLQPENHFGIPKITRSEIMKETIHYTLGKYRARRRYLRDIFFIGSWFSLKPITSVKIFVLEEANIDSIFDSLSDDEKEQIAVIRDDRAVIEKFILKAKRKKYDVKNFDSFLALSRDSWSTMQGINYLAATIGFWFLFNIENFEITELPFNLAIMMRYPIDKDDWPALVDHIDDRLTHLLDLSDQVSKKISVQENEHKQSKKREN